MQITEKMTEVRRLLESGMTVTEVSRHTGRQVASVRSSIRAMKRLGVQVEYKKGSRWGGRHKWNTEEAFHELCVLISRSRKSFREAASELFPGIAFSTVYSALRRNETAFAEYRSSIGAKRCYSENTIVQRTRSRNKKNVARYRQKNRELVRIRENKRNREMMRIPEYVLWVKINRIARETAKSESISLDDARGRLRVPSSWRWVNVDYSQHEIDDLSSGHRHVWDGNKLIPEWIGAS